MDTVILWVGLPGSGKTYHANKICDIVIDDITDITQLPSDEELETKVLGITDVNFCDINILDFAYKKLKEMYPNHIIVPHYFENDVDKCRSNVLYRNDGRNVEGTLIRFSKIYDPPKDATKVWSK